MGFLSGVREVTEIIPLIQSNTRSCSQKISHLFDRVRNKLSKECICYRALELSSIILYMCLLLCQLSILYKSE